MRAHSISLYRIGHCRDDAASTERGEMLADWGGGREVRLQIAGMAER